MLRYEVLKWLFDSKFLSISKNIYLGFSIGLLILAFVELYRKSFGGFVGFLLACLVCYLLFRFLGNYEKVLGARFYGEEREFVGEDSDFIDV